MNQMLFMVKHAVEDALREQSALAIGRLHQTLAQFAEMGSSGMMQIPREFSTALKNFIAAKIESSPVEPMASRLRDLVDTC